MKGGRAVAKILKMEGTDFVAHYPFVPFTQELLDEGIRVITTRHERTSVAIADAYTRFSMGHKNGVATCQVGWGAHNILGGLGQAYDDLSPMLMIPCGFKMDQLDMRTWDSARNFACVTKWSARLNKAERVSELMRIAYTRLRTGRPAPILLELMEDVLTEDVPDEGFYYEPVKGWKYQGDPHDIKVAVRALLNANSPVLYVGDGVLQADATNELKEFVELVQTPVITSIKGKSAFPENHSLSLGMRGNASWRFLKRADLVVGIGTSLSGSFSLAVPPGKEIIICNIGEFDVNLFHKMKHAIIGDAKLVLKQLIDEVKRQTNGYGRKRDERLEKEIAREKDIQLKQWLPKLTSNEKPINPYRVVWDMMKTFDRKNLVITHESGSPREQATAFWESIIPRSYLGWGYSTNLGFSWGAAMAAKIMWPEKLCVNWVGDAAMGHNATEMETALREELPILTVLSNNSGYAIYGIGNGSKLPKYLRRRVVSSSTHISYADMAESLGCYGERVEEPDELIPALKRGVTNVNSGRPSLIEVITSFEVDKVSREIPSNY